MADDGLSRFVAAAGEGLTRGGALARATLVPERLDRLPRALLAAAAYGPTLAGGLAAAAARYPEVDAIVDDEGGLTYRQLWQRSDALAVGLRARGVGPGTHLGLLARNHRGFVVAMLAGAKLGADLVFLNTGFAAPQLADVAGAEAVDTLVYDDEFTPLVGDAGVAVTVSGSEADALAATPGGRLRPSRQAGRIVILTSGTTGRPKGAVRASTGGGIGGLALLTTVPVRVRATTVIAAPLFHAWGLSNLGMALGLSNTVVLHRQFDPEATVAAIAHHRARGLVVVPVMLQRILAVGPGALNAYDTSSLRFIASSGSALGAPLVTATLRQFGSVLYNVYGSTEVALASIATPADLQAAPSTAGRVPPGSTVRVLDDQGHPVPTGGVGRVFVGSSARFDGYTTGGGKESIDGLLSSGDLGHFDADGRLFVEGREDDMVVSGGENVYPGEVEDLLAGHPAVADVAVVGVPDAEFGQRLKAFVVRRPGAALTEAEVKGHVRSNLARYKVPAAVAFVDELPRTTTGKVRKADLRAGYPGAR